MSKFQIGQVVKTNEHYQTEYKRIFKREPKKKGGVILDIYDDGINSPVYFFTEPDKYGNREGLSENFVELAFN